MAEAAENSNKNYFIWTVGCQMNVADSNYVAAALQKRGYSEVEDLEAADVVVLNSCVVASRPKTASSASSVKWPS